MKYQNGNFNFKELKILSITCFNNKNTTHNLLTFNNKNYDNVYKQFSKEIKAKDNSIQLEIVDNLSTIKEDDVNFILINEGSANFEQISNFLDDIALTKIKISGWFFLHE